ncbi:MAG: hypothetical protein ACR2P2_19160 [Nakamurella sp.]
MADYFAEPVWHRAANGAAASMISLDRLPLSEELKHSLRVWAKRYDALMDTDNEWLSHQDEDRWNADGRTLIHALRAELGPKYDVRLFDRGNER